MHMHFSDSKVYIFNEAHMLHIFYQVISGEIVLITWA